MSRLIRIVLATLALVPAAFAQWNEQVLYSFQAGADGSQPVGSVVFDKQGNLYGVTTNGGASNCAGVGGCGIVYELTPPVNNGGTWTETILHVFQGLAFGDGSTPAGGLVMDSAGNLYGTTAYDGTGQCTLIGYVVGCGTVFEMSPPSQSGGTWTETVLYSFLGGNDGSFPWGDLTFDQAGNLYGATRFGGGKGTNCGDSLYTNCGTIFELSPPHTKGGAWTEKVLHSFAGVEGWSVAGDGAAPNGGLVLDSAGDVYGTTQIGGVNCKLCPEQGCGTVFELLPQKDETWTEAVLHDFLNIPDGANPVAGLAFDAEENLYGTTASGGTGSEGTVFELEHQAGSNAPWLENILYNWNVTNGALPSAPVLLDAKNGALYITAAGGGTSRGGTFSELQDPGGAGWTDTVLYNFVGGGTDAAHPDSKLVLHSDALYGNSLWGGTGQACNGGCGAVYKLWP